VFLGGKEPAVPIKYGAECVMHVVWTLWIGRAENRTPDRTVVIPFSSTRIWIRSAMVIGPPSLRRRIILLCSTGFAS